MVADKPQNQHYHDAIDFEFISKLEGGCVLKGYVPDHKNSKSGVTIATGFDLGARNDRDLRKIGLSPVLIGKLYPYLGRKSTEAYEYIQQHPLRISKNEGNIVDTGVKRLLIEKLVERYNEDSQLAFNDLPACWQTVIASVEFQYGSIRKACPKFWSYVTQQEWDTAINELKSFGDNYASRRNQEAEYALQNS
ncbi:pesticin C-terminus-like muramidase [Glaciecola petra]|uniref:Pesticin C-terminus-like muramidase n=1 Tax=Glaciecola petra TaxID=3075602 RepID=A0ABU2ZUD1_9ALTE|nr:pesticin C-terminus-like muramidase [Aestuariibacter sp. P117]MDT0596236.1 pesticin C-terminus-like muramidase [Aestuariibacter sp. P117]